MNDSTGRRRDRRPPIGATAVSALLACIFLAFPVQTFTYDSLDYALALRNLDWSKILHQHHLLYEPLCLVLHRCAELAAEVLRAGMEAVSEATVMRIVSSLAAALAWLLCLRLMLRCSVPPCVALPLSLAASLSYSPWRFAGLGEPYALHLALTLWMFTSACALGKESGGPERGGGGLPRRPALEATIASLLALLNHQAAFLYLPSAFILALGAWKERRPLEDSDRDGRPPRLALALPFMAAALLAALAYTGTGLVLAAPGYASDRIAGYLLQDRYCSISTGKLATAFVAAADSFQGRALPSSPLPLPAVLLSMAASLSLFGLAVSSVFKCREALAGPSAHLQSAAASALALHFLAFSCLDAGSPCYWTVVPLFTCLLLAPPLSSVLSSPPQRATGLGRLVPLLLAVLAACGPSAVFLGSILPQSRAANYRPYYVLAGLERNTGPGDVVWVMGGNVMERLIRLRAPSLRCRSFFDLLMDGLDAARRDGDGKPLSRRSGRRNVQGGSSSTGRGVPPPAADRSRHVEPPGIDAETAAALEGLRRLLVRDLAGAGRVLLFHDLYDGRFKPLTDKEGRTIGGEVVASVFSRYRPLPALKGDDGKIYLWRLVPVEGRSRPSR